MINPANPNITNEPRSSTEIEGDIRRTRGRMDATLDELGERLTARSIVNSALDWWESRTGGPESNASSKAKHVYRSVGRQVKEHPMPSLLIGAGLAWIIVDAAAGEDEDERSGDPTSARGRTYGGSFETTADRFGAAGSMGAIEPGNAGEHDGDGPGFGETAKQMASQATGAISDAAGAVK